MTDNSHEMNLILISIPDSFFVDHHCLLGETHILVVPPPKKNKRRKFFQERMSYLYIYIYFLISDIDGI